MAKALKPQNFFSIWRFRFCLWHLRKSRKVHDIITEFFNQLVARVVTLCCIEVLGIFRWVHWSVRTRNCCYNTRTTFSAHEKGLADVFMIWHQALCVPKRGFLSKSTIPANPSHRWHRTTLKVFRYLFMVLDGVPHSEGKQKCLSNPVCVSVCITSQSGENYELDSFVLRKKKKEGNPMGHPRRIINLSFSRVSVLSTFAVGMDDWEWILSLQGGRKVCHVIARMSVFV